MHLSRSTASLQGGWRRARSICPTTHEGLLAELIECVMPRTSHSCSMTGARHTLLALAGTCQAGSVSADPGARHALRPSWAAPDPLCPGTGAVLVSSGRTPEGCPLAFPLLVVL